MHVTARGPSACNRGKPKTIEFANSSSSVKAANLIYESNTGNLEEGLEDGINGLMGTGKQLELKRVGSEFQYIEIEFDQVLNVNKVCFFAVI